MPDTPPRRGPDPPRPGDVVRYAYLWTHEAEGGREEGGKDRPCAVVLATRTVGGTIEVVVAPVTSRAPANPEEAVEVPAATRRRLGLQADPCWVVVTEVNRFAWPGPDLRPVRSEAGGVAWAYGALPASLLARVRDAVVARARGRTLRATSRSA